MKKIVARLTAVLALVAFAVPVLACEYMNKTTTASSKESAKPVATASKTDAKKADPKAKGVAPAKQQAPRQN